MRIVITTAQLRKLLADPKIKPHYPIVINMKKVSKEDLADLAKLLKKKA